LPRGNIALVEAHWGESLIRLPIARRH